MTRPKLTEGFGGGLIPIVVMINDNRLIFVFIVSMSNLFVFNWHDVLTKRMADDELKEEDLLQY